jgi:hypothetical protein
MIDDSFDYFHRDQIVQFFKNKQPQKMERYIKVLSGLIDKGTEKNKSLNKKYIK